MVQGGWGEGGGAVRGSNGGQGLGSRFIRKRAARPAWPGPRSGPVPSERGAAELVDVQRARRIARIGLPQPILP